MNKDYNRFCRTCGWNDSDYGCTSPGGEELWQCPMYIHYHPEEVKRFNEDMKRGKEMRVIIANNGTNITYEHITTIYDSDEDLILISSAEDSIHITFNGWLIAKVASCIIPKKMLTCVDDVFLDTRVGGV